MSWTKLAKPGRIHSPLLMAYRIAPPILHTAVADFEADGICTAPCESISSRLKMPEKRTPRLACSFRLCSSGSLEYVGSGIGESTKYIADNPVRMVPPRTATQLSPLAAGPVFRSRTPSNLHITRIGMRFRIPADCGHSSRVNMTAQKTPRDVSVQDELKSLIAALSHSAIE